jgi:phosphate transport system substrate-binding protein
VIGNSAYSGKIWPDLQGEPLRDAEKIRNVLQRLGFDVVYRQDADIRQMEDALQEFRRTLQQHPGALALVFYSGHGAQALGEAGSPSVDNYLIPAHTDLLYESDVRYKALGQERIEAAIRSAGADAGVIILDACRDNGLERGTRAPALRGLDSKAGVDILVVYSAASGKWAYNDGSFATALADEIVHSGPLTEALYRVRARVIDATRSLPYGPQEPEILSKLNHRIVLVGEAREVQASESPAYLLRIHGSNTIGTALMPALVTSFMEQKEHCTSVRSVPTKQDDVYIMGQCNGVPEEVEILSHGSLTGLEDIGSGEADIAMSSDKFDDVRTQLPPSVLKNLARLGDLASPAAEHVIALDGIGVIVHANNPVSEVSLSQLGGIFSGAVTDWSSVGGRPGDGAIHIYARDDNSGTWQFFNSAVLQKFGETLSPAASRVASSLQLSAEVASDPQGIGFIGLSYIGSNRALALHEEGAAALKPATCTVKTEEYVLRRRLYLYTSNQPKQTVQRFIQFATSSEAWPIVEKAGFVNLDPAPDPRCTVPFKHSQEWVAVTKAATRLSTNFNFVPNSYRLDNKAAQELHYLVDELSKPAYAHRRVVLIGYSDSQGPVPYNRLLSMRRATAVSEALGRELRQAGLSVTIADVVGLGPQDFIAENATADGRERNRRVEVWVRP